MLREKGFTQFPVVSVNDWEDGTSYLEEWEVLRLYVRKDIEND